LGGAGYTKEWPAEQYLRDARVLSIYEGTSGMQALDLTMRRVLGDEGRAMAAFVGKVRSDLASAGESYAGRQMVALLALLEEGARGLSKANALAVAYPFLQLASLATTGWIALRLTMLTAHHCTSIWQVLAPLAAYCFANGAFGSVASCDG
jgi:hypothetical protein